jgi:hypothetical protein
MASLIMGSKRFERKLRDENENVVDSKPASVKNGEADGESSSPAPALDISPTRRPLRTTSSSSPTPSSRTTRTSASRIRSSRLALEELEEEGDDASKPVQPPLRKLSEHSAAQGSYRPEPSSKKTKSKTATKTKTESSSKKTKSSSSQAQHELHKAPLPTFGKWAAPEHHIQQPRHNLSLLKEYVSTNNNRIDENDETVPAGLPDQTMYPSTNDLSSRSSLTGDWSLRQFDSLRSESDTASTTTLDMVLAKRYAARNEDVVATRLTPPQLATIQSQEVALCGQEAATGVLIDDDDEDIYKTKRRQPSDGIRPPPFRASTTAPTSNVNKNRMQISPSSSTPNRSTLISDVDEANQRARRSDSLSTMSTMPDPPSLRQGGHYTQPGAYRMTSGEEPRMTDVDSMGGSLRTQTTTVTRPPILEASLVRDEETASLRAGPPGPADNDDDDDECPSPPPPAHYTVSLGDLTHMTAATTASPIVEAQPLDEAHTFREFFANRKVKVTICALSVVFIMLALGTIYGVTGFVFDNQQKTPPPDDTTPPTPVPTIPGDPNLEYFVDVALPEYTRQALRKQNAPQSKALAWLKNNTHLEQYPLSQRLQRFALATFYYAMGGDRRWEHTTGWLSDDNECTWYSRTNVSFCEKGEYTELNLQRNVLRGTLPKEIALLSSLEILDLNINIITGFLPTTLGEMSNLREIHICKYRAGLETFAELVF